MSTKTEQQRVLKETLNLLAEAGGKLTAEEDILFMGTKLVLPSTMTLKEAIRFLTNTMNDEEQLTSYQRTYNYRPWDGAFATMKSIKKAFGAMGQKSTKDFWGNDVPPNLITIPVSPNDTEQVPWGELTVPHMPGVVFITSGMTHQEYGTIFVLHARGPRRWRHHIEGIFRLVEQELEENSIYRGKAFDGQDMPQFLDLKGVDPEKVVYADETTTQLEANIWSLLRYSDQMVELGVPLKRAVLLEGPYGTGKTLAAYLTAKEAIENGWSFILCRPGRDKLEDVMATARLYQPAVVFFEDVDVISEATSESDKVRALLDIFDGIQAKGTRIICVLTTNHVELIHKGMVRPGRLDAVIHIGALDARGVQRLIEALVPTHLLDPFMDWPEVVGSMDGFLPAFCREAVDRAVRYNVARNEGKATELSTADFVSAANGLRPQLELMEGAKERVLGDSVSSALSKVVEKTIEKAKVSRGPGAENWASLHFPEDTK